MTYLEFDVKKRFAILLANLFCFYSNLHRFNLPFSYVLSAKRILVLGGGDGLAIREILKHSSVEQVTLVDLDPQVVELAKSHPDLLKLNEGAMLSPKVEVMLADALTFLQANQTLFDIIMASRNPFGPLPDQALDQVSLRFLSKEATEGLFHWPQDLKEKREQAQVSSLLEPQIFNIYQKEVQEAGYL